ncbi:MAG: molybdenum cofactor guanylyltransferase [Candidatus Hodarchaeales archaeon]|jgi:molybdopterin-guanine dinucleotide biosynthesis protein A
MRSLVINAGGDSSRLKNIIKLPLGKAWVKIQGKPLLIRNLESLQDHVEEILIIVRDAFSKRLFETELVKYRSLLDLEKARVLVERAETTLPGPIRGIMTGIQACCNEIVWFIPCDHPFLFPGVFKSLETNLTGQSIVTLQSGLYSYKSSSHCFDPNLYSFDPQFFVANLETLAQISLYVNELPIDLYRLIPKSTFIPATTNEARISLLGVNVPEDLENVTKRMLTPEEATPENNIPLQEVKKPKISFQSLKSELENHLAFNLYKQGHFYLLERLYMLNHLSVLPVSLEDLVFSDWKQWQEVCPLIAFHCGRRWLKTVNPGNRSYSFFSDVQAFNDTWSKKLGKKVKIMRNDP